MKKFSLAEILSVKASLKKLIQLFMKDHTLIGKDLFYNLIIHERSHAGKKFMFASYVASYVCQLCRIIVFVINLVTSKIGNNHFFQRTAY